VDAIDRAQEVRAVLSVVAGIAPAASVAARRPHHSVGRDVDITAVVVSERLTDLEQEPAARWTRRQVVLDQLHVSAHVRVVEVDLRAVRREVESEEPP